VLVNTERGIVNEKSPPMAYFNHMIIGHFASRSSYSKGMRPAVISTLSWDGS